MNKKTIIKAAMIALIFVIFMSQGALASEKAIAVIANGERLTFDVRQFYTITEL